MKKWYFLIAFVSLVFAQQGFAQVKFGIRGGITTSSINDAKSFVSQSGQEIVADLKGGQVGWTAGAVLRLKIAILYLQPELLFTSNKYAYQTSGGQDYQERLLSLDVPVLIGLKFGPLRINAGPEAHVGVNKTSDLVDLDFYKEAVQTFTVGWVGGAGLDLLGLMLDVRYHGNLRKVGTAIEVGNETIEFDKNPGMWSFTAGFLF